MTLSESEIHLWFVYDEDIRDKKLLSKYHTILNDQERLKQKRFYFAKDQHQYLVTRAMVRSVLSLYTDSIPPSAWEFKNNRYGKPYISNSSLNMLLNFNISHTEKLVVMAVTLGQEIGVDVEYLPRLDGLLEVASRFFSPMEIKQLFKLPLEEQNKRFSDLWTLKEAYIKACGMGLSISLDQFSYNMSSEGKIKISFDAEREDQAHKWSFWQVKPSEMHKVSMAIKSDHFNRQYSVSMREFIPSYNLTEVNYPITQGLII